MSKPWDKLRVPEKKPPMVPGEWVTNGGTDVSWKKFDDNDVQLTIGGVTPPSLTCKSFRELAEFCTELADQLDGK